MKTGAEGRPAGSPPAAPKTAVAGAGPRTPSGPAPGSAARPPRRRWIRAAFLALAGFFVLIGAAAAWLAFHPDHLRPVAERVTAAVTGRPVSLGSLDLRIEERGITIEAGALRIGEATVERTNIRLAGARSHLRGSGVRLPSGSSIETFRAPLDLSLSGRPGLSTVDAFGVVLVAARGEPSDPPRPLPLGRLLVVPRILLGFGLERLTLHSGEIRYHGRELTRSMRMRAVLEAAGSALAFHGELSAAGGGAPLPFSGRVRRPMDDGWEIETRLAGDRVPMNEVRSLIDLLEPSPPVRAAVRRVSSDTRFELSARLARSGIGEIVLDFTFGPREDGSVEAAADPALGALALQGLRITARAVPAPDLSDWTVHGALDWSGTPGGAEAAPSPFTLHRSTGGSGSLRFSAERIEVPAAAALVSRALPSGHPLRARIERLQPAGMIDGLTVSRGSAAADGATAADGASAPFRLGAALSGFGAAFPGPDAALSEEGAALAGMGAARIDDVDARIEFDGRAWRVRLMDDRLRVSVPSVWSAPRALALRGEVRIEPADGGFRAHTGNLEIGLGGITGRLSGTLHAPRADRDGAPRLDVEVRLNDTTLAAVGAALPDRRAVRFAQWYRRAVRSGRLAGGALSIRGDPRRIPFAAGDGEFEASGTVRDVEFAYARGWPTVHAQEAKVRASGPVLEFLDGRGAIFDTAVTVRRVRIEDVTAPQGRVRLSLAGAGPAADLLEFVRTSPLGARAGGAADDVRAHGPATGAVALDVPYGRGARTRPLGFSGEIALGGVDFRLAGRRAILEDVRGALEFHAEGLSGGPLPGRMRGEEIESRVEFAPGAGLRLRFSGEGDGDWFAAVLDDLADLPPEETRPLLSRVHGRTAWEAEYDSRRGVVFRSDLRTASVDLPPPFGKPAGVPREFEVSLAPGKATWKIDAGYAPGLRGVFEVAETAGAWALARGGVSLDGAPPRLPAGNGIEVSGRLPEIDLDRWIAAAAGGRGAAADWLSRIDRVEVETAAARLLGRRLALRKLDLVSRGGAGFRIGLAGKGAEGEVSIPADLASGRAAVRLRRLHLGEPIESETNGRAESASGAGARPGQWPSFDVQVESLRFGKIDLGTVRARGERTGDGLEIEEVAADSPGLEMRGRGSWRASGGGPSVSRFAAKLDVRDPSQVLSAAGIEGETLAGRRTEMRFDLAWPGAPAAAALERLEGDLELDAEDGRLPNLRMGAAGRLLALLNLDALPRVLALDLSHVFGEGFVYDRIVARIHLEGGTAGIREFTVSGPAAVVEANGRVDLVSRRYDQEISVIPRFTRSGALGPLWITAWPVLTGNFLVEKLTGDKPILDRLFRLEYRLRGPWDDPEIERVRIGPVQTKE